MKQALIIITLIAGSFLPAVCQEMPSDIPENHFAYEAVYDLVDRGINVSQGYPDGTFRGNRKTNRYEIAYFMSSLALSLKRTTSVEIDISDLKEEINWLRNEIKSIKDLPEMQQDLKLYGSAEFRGRFGSLLAYDPGQKRVPSGPETNYRFKYTVEKTLGKDANLLMNLDTMDGGFNSPTLRTFPSRLMDIEGNFVADLGFEKPVKVRAIVGPGSVLHRDTSGVAPSDDGKYFSRPRTSFFLSTPMAGYDVTFGYAARAVAANGRVGTSEINLQFVKEIGPCPIIGTTEASYTARYMMIDIMDPTSGPNDIIQEVSLSMAQNPVFSEKIMIGMSSADHPLSRYFLNFEAYIKNLNDRGTNINFKFNSAGVDYRLPFEQLEFTPLNLFDKKTLDGTIDIGLEVIQPLSKQLIFTSKFDWVGSSQWEMAKNVPGASYTEEHSFDYSFGRDLILNIFYRYYQVPSRINQFSATVPEVSDMLGAGLIYKF